MRGYCAAFPRRSHPSLPYHCLRRAHIFSEKCSDQALPWTWAPRPHTFPSPVPPKSVPHIWPLHSLLPRLAPPSALRRGTWQLLSGASGSCRISSCRGSSCPLFQGLLCHQSPLGSCLCAPPRPQARSSFPYCGLLLCILMLGGTEASPGTVCHPPTPALWAVVCLAPFLNAVCPGRAALLNDDWLDGGIPSRGRQ